MLDLALHIVGTKRGDLKPEKFEDQYEDALKRSRQAQKTLMRFAMTWAITVIVRAIRCCCKPAFKQICFG